MKISEYLREEDVKIAISNTPQIAFEVTDACNLQCTYCAYGKFYSDYDIRENKKLSVDTAIMLLEYMNKLWNSSYNNSINKNVNIGFYGGEPTLNMPFIEKIVDYVENKINCKTRKFTFSMTTNALLLHKYMDYFVFHKFNLLISLDGDEYNTSYRVNHSCKPMFNTIVKNVDLLNKKHPDYFKTNVNFNSVLHNRNSVESIYDFFKKRYNKIASIGELNNAGISEEMKEEYSRTYKNAYVSLHQSKNYDKIERDMFLNASSYITLSTYLAQYSEFTYKDYNELLFGKNKLRRIIPTGTCIPFSKKVFVTVNGKLLPCERIGHQFAIGELTDKEVKIDFNTIAGKYNNYYTKLEKQCSKCFSKKVCTQCVFSLQGIEDKLICYRFMSKKDFEIYQNDQLFFLAEHPKDYNKIMTEVLIK